MSSVNYEEQLIGAIQTIVDDSIAKANFDKTIKATIVKCIDETIGKYTVKYQDSTFYAYSNNMETIYRAGTGVYVLVPGNDTSQNKTIIGSIDQVGVDFVSVVEGDNAYEYLGKNCIGSTDTFELCSYKGKQEIILYSVDEEINLINFNPIDASEYIPNATTIICGGTIRTELSAEQKYKGNYGINFELIYLDNNGNEVAKNYLVDINEMKGSPYNYINASRQYGIFNIEGSTFSRVSKISIFAYDFPNYDETKANDIFISNIELNGAVEIPDGALSSYSLTFATPQGVYFDNIDTTNAKRELNAIVKIKGKNVNSDSQLVKYYWFKENNRVSASSKEYNKYGGAGWECLNEYNLVQEATADVSAIVEWIPGGPGITILKSDLSAKSLQYKCVAVYDESNIFSKTITFYNYSSTYVIDIESTNGTTFYFDTGSTNLITRINGEEEQGNDYTYSWSYIDNTGIFRIIEQSDINAYNEAKNNYEAIMEGIAAGTIIQANVQDELNALILIINAYENELRAEKNRLNNVNANMIVDFSTFKCSVYYQDEYIGTSAITLINSFDAQERELTDYSLIIDGGNQVFQYNEKGISPASRSALKPQAVETLSFRLFDKEGNEIPFSSISPSNIIWSVPNINTMITTPLAPSSETENEKIYIGEQTLPFGISSIYYTKKRNNDIILKIIYDGHIIVAKTTLTFIKQGEIGTNGTDVVCKLIPNGIDSILPEYPILIYNMTTGSYTLNFTTNSRKWLKMNIWKDGSLIFSGTETDTRLDDPSEIVEIEWSILKNKYSNIVSDNSNFLIDDETGEISFDSTEYAPNISSPANIIKCTATLDGSVYYATIPFILVRISSSNYTVDLTDGSGFYYGMYLADGTNAAYDSASPFELNIFKNSINISRENSTNYVWDVKGSIYLSNWQSVSNLIERKGMNFLANKNEIYYQPAETKYDGLSLNNGLYCEIYDNSDLVGTILIPIHLYLNRYGQAALNGWDGNSISIDNEGGVILSPQVGAGHKELDNSFTGVFMGDLKQSDGTEIESGLFGYNHGEQTIKLDAKTGSAAFGKTGDGQIIIDPAAGAKIRGGNYNYTGNEQTGSGMEIDLAKPTIKYGTGNFELDEDGNMKCRNADIRGNVFLPDGGKVIGGDGLYTMFNFSNAGQVGWHRDAYSDLYDLGLQRLGFEMPVVIPEHFKVTQATVSLYGSATKVRAMNEIFWCSPKYITLQQGLGDEVQYEVMYGDFPPSGFTEAPNVRDNNGNDIFGALGWNPTPFSDSDTTWRTITSTNFSNVFLDNQGNTKAGSYTFYLNSKITYDENVDMIWGLYQNYQSENSTMTEVTNIYITNNGVQRIFSQDEYRIVWDAIDANPGNYPKYASNNGDIYHIESGGRTWNLNRHDFSAWFQPNAQALRSNYMFTSNWGMIIHYPNGSTSRFQFYEANEVDFWRPPAEARKLTSSIFASINVYGYIALDG